MILLRTLLAFLIFVGLASPASAQPSAPAAAPPPWLRLVDLTGDFDAFYTRTAGLAPEARFEALRAAFADKLPGFYDLARHSDPDRYRAFVERGLASYPEQRAGIMEVSRRFAGLIGPAARSFEAAFGPLPRPETVYLLDSFGEMDGGTRDLPGGTKLIFGADMIARLHLGHDIAPFFHHELFHVFHANYFRGCDAVWCSLWEEGLATYVAAALNPNASDDELMLSFPEPLRPAVDTHRQQAVCAVVERMHSTDPAAYGPLFTGSQRLGPDLPPRFAYYVGYLAMRELARTRTLAELARLNAEQARPLLEATLRGMAACPEAPSPG